MGHKRPPPWASNSLTFSLILGLFLGNLRGNHQITSGAEEYLGPIGEENQFVSRLQRLGSCLDLLKCCIAWVLLDDLSLY